MKDTFLLSRVCRYSIEQLVFIPLCYSLAANTKIVVYEPFKPFKISSLIAGKFKISQIKIFSRLRSTSLQTSSQGGTTSTPSKRARLLRGRGPVGLQRVRRCGPSRSRRSRLHLRQDRPSSQLQVGRQTRCRSSVRTTIDGRNS